MNVLMPQLGETVTEGTISRWYKAVDDKVSAGDILLEIETDKTAMEIPAAVTGVLSEIRAQAGQTVAVGAVIAIVSDGAADSPSSAPPGHAPASPAAVPMGAGAAPSPPTASDPAAPAAISPIDPFHGLRTPERNFGRATLPSGVKVTPLARRLASQAGIDFEAVRGSGPDARVVAADVRAASRDVALPATASLGAAPSTEQLKAQ